MPSGKVSTGDVNPSTAGGVLTLTRAGASIYRLS